MAKRESFGDHSEKDIVTVADMIAALELMPPHLPVLTRGYEDGYQDAERPTLAKVFFNYPENSAWFYGPHERVDGEATELSAGNAVIIDRRR